VGQFESVLWDRPVRRAPSRRAGPLAVSYQGELMIEWTAQPLGRWGRPLLGEIETYLAFFAIARTGLERDDVS
jgi:hypothetical protein